MASVTYEPIATTTLTGNAKNISFTSIPSTYTDLIIIMNYSINQPSSCWVRFNGNSATNYSFTELRGNGSSAYSTRGSNQTSSYFAFNVFPDTTPGNSIMNILNYSNTNTNKTFLTRTNAITGSYPGTAAYVGLWRQTAAINEITINMDGDAAYYYLSGSTFTIYGVKAS